ncbi:LANO_0G10286g1_1 [Lachancea nothofagi CBS 11611]|uniref:Ribosome biogenesis protein SLX9 n=1 Tax=Lachancea nothofagi CBS 11611 TaxID=1266666 RepID=A0A1G4KJ17_9SACH|nr:LANO_0G10286g1_1 [Lachancea nothofagi CBS 11611]
MVAKKRTQLRTKAALRLGQSKEDNEIEVEQLNLPEDPKAFLHQARESKKDKILSKSQSFLSKLHERTSLNGAISKSALRRRKRKQRDQLKPRMEDLLVSLEQDGVQEATADSDENGDGNDNKLPQNSTASVSSRVTRITTPNLPLESGSVSVKRNQPNIRNQRGAKQLAQNESDRFQTVLQNKQFQQNPFAALKEVIKMQKY